jgi:uncharacterized membrane protein YjjP (DUF1212 family)
VEPGSPAEHADDERPADGERRQHDRRRGDRRRGDRRRRAPGTSTEPLHLPELEEREAYLVLDLALRAGEVLLAAGAGAADVTATNVALADSCGLRNVECDITFTSITLSHVRAPDVAPVTSVRLVRQRYLDYTRVTEVHNLVLDLVEGRTDRATAAVRLDRITSTAFPYPGWVVTAFRSMLAGAIVVLLGGGPLVTLASLASTVAVDRLNRLLWARGVPVFFQNVAGAAVATGVAVALVAADIGVRPALVVAGGIILLLPGVTLVGAVQDAITGFLVTASARAFEVLLLSAGIVTGVALALEVGSTLGVSVFIREPSPTSLRLVPLQVLAAAAAAAAFAGANYAPKRTLPAAGVAGAIGWLTLITIDSVGLSPTFATAGAAVVVGLGSYSLAHRQQAPPLLYVAAGVIPLLPGLTIYDGMSRLATGDTIGGIVELSQAVSIGLALAAGVILGEFLAQPPRRELPRVDRRLAGPRLAGPLPWSRRRSR